MLNETTVSHDKTDTVTNTMHFSCRYGDIYNLPQKNVKNSESRPKWVISTGNQIICKEFSKEF